MRMMADFSTVPLQYDEIRLKRGNGYVVDGYVYCKNSESDTLLRLKCQSCKAGCKATAKIVDGLAYRIQEDHSHPKPDLISLIFRDRVLEKASELADSGVSLSMMYNLTVEEMMVELQNMSELDVVVSPNTMLASLPKLSSVRSSMHRRRTALLEAMGKRKSTPTSLTMKRAAAELAEYVDDATEDFDVPFSNNGIDHNRSDQNGTSSSGSIYVHKGRGLSCHMPAFNNTNGTSTLRHLGLMDTDSSEPTALPVKKHSGFQIPSHRDYASSSLIPVSSCGGKLGSSSSVKLDQELPILKMNSSSPAAASYDTDSLQLPPTSRTPPKSSNLLVNGNHSIGPGLQLHSSGGSGGGHSTNNGTSVDHQSMKSSIQAFLADNMDYAISDDGDTVSQMGTLDVAPILDRHYWSEDETNLLMELYVQNLGRFKERRHTGITIWEEIANQIKEKLGVIVTGDQCHSKLRNMKRTFIRASARGNAIFPPDCTRDQQLVMKGTGGSMQKVTVPAPLAEMFASSLPANLASLTNGSASGIDLSFLDAKPPTPIRPPSIKHSRTPMFLNQRDVPTQTDPPSPSMPSSNHQPAKHHRKRKHCRSLNSIILRTIRRQHAESMRHRQRVEGERQEHVALILRSLADLVTQVKQLHDSITIPHC